jgi:hypothetical protein
MLRRKHMKKVWKWVIGIVIVLVVVAVLVGCAFLLRNHYANIYSFAKSSQPAITAPGNNDQRGEGNWRYPGMMQNDQNDRGWRGMPMRGPGMMGFGRMGLFGGLARGLFSLVFLTLIVLGIVWLVWRLRKPAVPFAVAASAAPVSNVAPVMPVSEIHTCPKCGQPAQMDWKLCPYCGQEL